MDNRFNLGFLVLEESGCFYDRLRNMALYPDICAVAIANVAIGAINIIDTITDSNSMVVKRCNKEWC